VYLLYKWHTYTKNFDISFPYEFDISGSFEAYCNNDEKALTEYFLNEIIYFRGRTDKTVVNFDNVFWLSQI
jgi:hypothetical protein